LSPNAYVLAARQNNRPQTRSPVAVPKPLEMLSSSARPRSSFHLGPTLTILRLARCSHRRETRYADPLASERISAVLEWKSQPAGRPRVPVEVRKLIGEMAENNPTWGEERIADELLLKIGIQISPRTVRRYMPTEPKVPGMTFQRWKTFVRNHAKTIIACDFFIVVTATFRLVYVFVIMEVGSRRILHFNTTCHPTAEWTLQQFRESVTGEEPYRAVIHDRDSIYSRELDSSLRLLGLRVLRTPYRSPQANAFCERLIGSVRRECLDFMIPLNEGHIRTILKRWVAHFNGGRPHSSLRPGIPEPSFRTIPLQTKRHSVPDDHLVSSVPVLGGLHHEYKLEKIAA
jgi:putative transposase